MKDYKRVTIRNEDGSHSFMYDYNATTPQIKTLLDRLAELEDKIDEGTLVNVPYAIGQQLYCVFKNGKDVENVRISLITIKQDGSIDLRLNHYHSDGSYFGCFKYDPKYHLLFHDKTEALKKLEELIKTEVK